MSAQIKLDMRNMYRKGGRTIRPAVTDSVGSTSLQILFFVVDVLVRSSVLSFLFELVGRFSPPLLLPSMFSTLKQMLFNQKKKKVQNVRNNSKKLKLKI
jgi:hypothetical protein